MMNKKLSFTLFIFISLVAITIPSFAWNNAGHKMVAYMAYQQLTPNARQQVDALSQVYDSGYTPIQRFLYLSILPDFRQNTDFKSLLNWHYIDLPYSKDGTKTAPAESPNLQTGLAQAQQWLLSNDVSEKQKAIALSLLIHLVADAHQPLHCISLYSKDFPQGDRGGNYFLIHYPKAKNLHALWDRGLGSLLTERHRSLSAKQIKQEANKILQQHAKADLAVRCNMSTWLQECYNLAVRSYEGIQPYTVPSQNYIERGRRVVEQQLFIAAQRLAAVLNSIYGRKDADHVIQTKYSHCRRG